MLGINSTEKIACKWAQADNGLFGSGGKTKQTEPPSIAVADLFPSGVYPEGERQSYAEE